MVVFRHLILLQLLLYCKCIQYFWMVRFKLDLYVLHLDALLYCLDL